LKKAGYFEQAQEWVTYETHGYSKFESLIALMLGKLTGNIREIAMMAIKELKSCQNLTGTLQGNM